MKITVVIISMLSVQVSASFIDVFQGAVLSVQDSFGKLFSDVVTDVKDTVDCTILAVEHVLSLSDDATQRYYDKCGNVKNETMNNQQNESGVRTVEITISNNEDNLNKLLPGEIDAKIDETMSKYFRDYNPHDKLTDVERELAKETEKLAEVSSLVKQELEKLSSGIHIEFSDPKQKDGKASVDTVLQELRLLESVEQNIKNSSEGNEVHKIIENILHKLDGIAASEVSESAKVERILEDLSSKSNNTFSDLRKRLENWKKNEDKNLNTINKKIEEHETSPEYSDYLEKNTSVVPTELQLNGDVNDIYKSTTSKKEKWLNPEQPVLDGGFKIFNDSNDVTIVTVSTNSSVPESTQLLLARSSHGVPTTTSLHSIELSTAESIPIVLNITVSESLQSQPLNNIEPLVTMTMSTMPPHTSPAFASTNNIELSAVTNPKTDALKNSGKIYVVESSTTPNNSSKNDTTGIISTTPKTTRPAVITTGEITTPEIQNQYTYSNIIEDSYKTTVGITKNSYINEINHTRPIMEAISTVGSPAIIATNEQHDNDLNTTLLITMPSIKLEVDTNPAIYLTPALMSSTISKDNITTERVHLNEYNPRDAVTSTQSSVISNGNIEDVHSSSTVKGKSLNNAENTTQSLSLTTTVSTTSTVYTKETPFGARTSQGYDPRTSYQYMLNESPSNVINDNSIAPVNRFASFLYTTPNPVSRERVISSPTQPHMVLNEPPLYARNYNPLNAMPPPPYPINESPLANINQFLSSRYRSDQEALNNRMQPRIQHNLPLPYIRPKDPMVRFNRRPRTRFMSTESGFNEKRPLVRPISNGNRPPDVFNEKPGLEIHRPPKIKKTDNFDDPDYDAFFHIPSKDTEAHDQAVRDARKLIEDSIRSHRVMQNILNQKRKGVSAYNLPK